MSDDDSITNKIGVIVDSFGIGVREGLLKAKEVGAEGVQIYAVSGEMDPANTELAGKTRAASANRRTGPGDLRPMRRSWRSWLPGSEPLMRRKSSNRSGFSILRLSSARPS